MFKATVFISVLVCFYSSGFTQPKSILAVEVQLLPQIDGYLNEKIWKSAVPARQFITSTPSFGQSASDSTVVMVLYDNNSIYIGAYLYGDPGKISRQYTPRDQERHANVDYFAVFLDAYKDRQNAFQFLVTSRNVQTDARLSPNITPEAGVFGDLSWDAVWESKVQMLTDGWSVEIRIPLFSLRFSNRKKGDWGVQFLRFNQFHNETSYWNSVDPNVSGFVNQFGNLQGCDELLAPLRLSFSPYVSSGYRETPRSIGGAEKEWLKSGGMDVKYGLSESFTLDATLIPDFGQVISDNEVNNISPFEIRFRENRQFFTEGTELFNKADLFYSRRVGGEPEKYQQVVDVVGSEAFSNYHIMTNPSTTRLFNAIKFSGRTLNNLGIGIFNAVARNERAILRNTISGRDSVIATNVLSNYNVFVLDQALKNRSYITLTNTNVLRNAGARDANVTGLDLALYDKRNRFGLFLKPRYSKIFDSTGGYDGFHNYLEFGKVSGKLQYTVSNDVKSAMYDPNDLGFLLAPNEISNMGSISYNIFDPGKWLLNQQYGFSASQSYLYKPFEYQRTEFVASANWTFRNFWTAQIEVGSQPFWSNDFFELQTPSNKLHTPRHKLRRAPYYYLFADGTTDIRKRLYLAWTMGFAEGPLRNDPFYKLSLEARYRFSDRLVLTASLFRQHDEGQFGYSFMREISGEPILARRRYTDVTTILSGIYNFTPRMNITFRARHFWNRILNTNLYNVTPDGNWTERFSLMPSDFNMNYNIFNVDMFYTWDFMLGSRIIFAWKNSLGTDYAYHVNGITNRSYFRNFSEVLNTPHGNELSVRFIYFLDHQKLKK